MTEWYETEYGEIFNLSKVQRIVKDRYNDLYQIKAIYDKTDSEENTIEIIFECNDEDHRDFHFDEIVKLLNAAHTSCEC